MFLYKITELRSNACVLKFYLLLAAGRSRHLLLKVCLINCFFIWFYPYLISFALLHFRDYSVVTLLQTMSEIKRQNEKALLKAFQVDLLSIQSILDFKNSLQLWLQDSKMHPSVQLLINNAGILATSSRLTSEGYDQLHPCFLSLFKCC